MDREVKNIFTFSVLTFQIFISLTLALFVELDFGGLTPLNSRLLVELLIDGQYEIIINWVTTCSVRKGLQSLSLNSNAINLDKIVIGLTGGIATGKSTVSSLLKAAGIPIIDADIIARQVVEPGTPALAKIQATFGNEVLFPDGSLDRKKLGSIIFNDEVKRKQLNKIVHPAVRKAMLWQMLGYWIKGYKYCVMDVPLLIEGGLWQWVGLVVVVYW